MITTKRCSTSKTFSTSLFLISLINIFLIQVFCGYDLKNITWPSPSTLASQIISSTSSSTRFLPWFVRNSKCLIQLLLGINVLRLSCHEAQKLWEVNRLRIKIYFNIDRVLKLCLNEHITVPRSLVVMQTASSHHISKLLLNQKLTILDSLFAKTSKISKQIIIHIKLFIQIIKTNYYTF